MKEQLKGLNKPSECLIPAIFFLHSGKWRSLQTISTSILVYSIPEIILAYTHFAIFTEVFYNSVFNDYFSAQQ